MGGSEFEPELEEDWDDFDIEEWEHQEDERALSPAGIAQQNDDLLRQYHKFRCAADAVTDAWRDWPQVAAVALIGSVARPPWKEVPRFSPYRRERISLWHECKDVDLALWLTALEDLGGLRRAKDKALGALHGKDGSGVASHQLDVFVIEPGTDRYLGRLCRFNQCPKGKRECLVPGCGDTPFLQQHEGFRWRPKSLAADRAVTLFDRAAGLLRRAVDLPLPPAEPAEFQCHDK